ncbi:hypothetical protein JOB18_043282 [Solea senegalensis]|uniref:Uncharacterized protein n=1 Tax=Solea senegalensis TaxID=28829 RepID=A0AAV6SX39_SOLSE|nr:hypothetical protein JOB18_043282 [Solea senegalensis]
MDRSPNKKCLLACSHSTVRGATLMWMIKMDNTTGLTGDIQTCRDKREDGGWAIFHIFHVSGGFALGNNSLSPGFNVPQEPPGTFTRQWKVSTLTLFFNTTIS